MDARVQISVDTPPYNRQKVQNMRELYARPADAI